MPEKVLYKIALVKDVPYMRHDTSCYPWVKLGLYTHHAPQICLLKKMHIYGTKGDNGITPTLFSAQQWVIWQAAIIPDLGEPNVSCELYGHRAPVRSNQILEVKRFFNENELAAAEAMFEGLKGESNNLRQRAPGMNLAM